MFKKLASISVLISAGTLIVNLNSGTAFLNERYYYPNLYQIKTPSIIRNQDGGGNERTYSKKILGNIHNDPSSFPEMKVNWFGAPLYAHNNNDKAEACYKIDVKSIKTPDSDCDENVCTMDILSLSNIRNDLIRQEETIIFALIERAQFRLNKAIYEKGKLDLIETDPDINAEFLSELSFMEYLFLETERLHSKVRRYTSPDQIPFFPKYLKNPILPPLEFPNLLQDNDINVNTIILNTYINEIVPKICVYGDDEQYGSSTLCDINVLQALSRRIHMGKFVAEIKFQSAQEEYTRLIKANDKKGVMELLTNKEVEAKVLKRAQLKATTHGRDIAYDTSEYKVDPALIEAIYRDFIIPLTKEVEVDYLFQIVENSKN